MPFIPLDEDLGLVTIEAMTAGKPVLTTYDAGGPTEFVVVGSNGFVVEPTPAALGAGLAKLDRLASRPSTSSAARAAVDGISWHRVATELVGLQSETRRSTFVSRRGRPKLVVTSTFPVWPPRGGGQLRMYHLYRALGRRFDIDLICLSHPAVPASRRELADGMTEYVIPRSAEHFAREVAYSGQAGFPVTDIVDGQLITLTPDYVSTLNTASREAQCILMAHPFLYPAIQLLGRKPPLVYDAHNCEYVLKSQLLPDTDFGDELRELVRTVEGGACAEAELVLTVSQEDQQSMTNLYETPVDKFLLVPNGADLDAIPFTSMSVRQQNRLRWLKGLQGGGGSAGIRSVATFVGSWHPPNNEAGRAIVDMAPLLPNVAFVLMGGHCATLQHLRVPPNVFLLGLVSETVKQTILRTADVALAPLTSGSGTNLKVVEYLAAGLPLVSTVVGIRGLNIPVGVVRVAEIDDFPAAIRAELAAADGASARTERARTLVDANYGWRALGEVATRAIEERLGDNSRPAPAVGGRAALRSPSER